MHTYHPMPPSVPLSSLAADTPSSTTSTASNITTPSSSTFPFESLDLNPLPDIPSTFLPSYYPDSRWENQAFTAHSYIYHSPSNSNSERGVSGGPSSRHLLDGVPLSSPPRAPRPTTQTPTYDLSPGAYARVLPPVPRPWVPKRKAEWNELPFEDSGGGGGGGGETSNRIMATMASNNYTHSHSSSYPHDSNFSSSPPRNGASQNTPSYQDNYALPPNYRTNSSSSALSDPPPNSLGYPGILFNHVPLPENALNPPGWYDTKPPSTAEDYAKVLQIYQHLSAAMPHIQPITNADPGTTGQEYESLLGLAQEGQYLISGQSQQPRLPMIEPPKSVISSGSIQSGPASTHKRAEGKSRPATKCLGCGATETPEWRRGPMGPRTLCNACGLVHMKLQRKKRKLEEKAAAAAAAAKNGRG